eukprot:NODE_3999_length_1247_cov_17.212633_g3511_i0.p1 GENE.NODE_3999_length_1247_cov_17.212633_g3511_i0~~NODE_3999_length_1247_cov_17.212633_g3511_i0.p1  ORF type:complete len:399 (-),score=88.03 NODE_3999_length_1247_cov_17.212633_g3511_i0:49-1206(-)
MDRRVAENEARVRELQVTSERLADELELKRLKYRDVRAKHDELERQRAHINLLWSERQRGVAIRDRNLALRDTYDRLQKDSRENEEAVRRLESEIHQLQLEYEQERQARLETARSTLRRVSELSNELSRRSEDGIHERIEPMEALKRVKELDKTRERDLQCTMRELRELEAVVSMKTRRIAELEIGARRDIENALTSKNNQISSIHEEKHAERQRILAEIDELRRANREQAYNLKHGGPPVPKELVKSPKIKAEMEKTPKQKIFEAKQKQLSQDTKALTEQLKKLKIEISDLVQKSKVEKAKLDKLQAGHQKSLLKLDHELQDTRKAAMALIEQHRKLEDQSLLVRQGVVQSKIQYTKEKERYLLIEDKVPEEVLALENARTEEY